MRHSKSTVTITDIARRAGVSATAVSAALHGTGRVSDGQRALIQGLAREMNYQPSVAAQIMRSTDVHGVALIVTDDYETATESGVTAPLVAHFVRRCEIEALRYHIDYVRESLPDSPAPPSLRGGLVAGAIVAEKMPDSLREWLNGQDRYPWVCIDDIAPYTVVSSVDEGAVEAVRHLAALRHRNIAFGGPSRDILVHSMIQDGFLNAVKEYGLVVQDGWFEQFDVEHKPRVQQLEQYRVYAERLLTAADKPTAIVCGDTKLARVIIYVALKLGIRVPEDLSVIGYGTSGDAEKGIPCVTQIQANFGEMIDKSVTILRYLMAGKQVEQGMHRVPAKLVHRDTVARAVDAD